ncbi:hypothetical protein HNR46_001591 [Haloferula luteola]|uniref:Uncharacterized protein n=1 Tax=Haloferula luteola TaxID=595692 RepID=A0A840V033_9BACT|nr:hypothetical protein [Haloferula luteola]MBB5351355.1 hypothetical protein [Haloferula luteola]
MIHIEVNFEGIHELDAELKRLIGAMTGSEATELNQVAAQSAVLAARDYHLAFAQDRKWDNPSLGTHGPGRESTGFGEDIAVAWHVASSDATGAIIANGAPLYRHKVKGGPITPKRVKFLTIPIVPEAHGRRAIDYSRDFSSRLFMIPGKMALFERVENEGDFSVLTPTRIRKRNGRNAGLAARSTVRAVYLLSRGITQDPWLGALPPEEDLIEAFRRGWLEELATIVDMP